ncbi:MAG: hypothetical protein H6648_01685 [Caldilineae bacterium]|nr:hypothetical protein [Chloroflexota bacterium]MCB9175842.1 hypothetical protein [Caldilineae bacterium]
MSADRHLGQLRAVARAPARGAIDRRRRRSRLGTRRSLDRHLVTILSDAFAPGGRARSQRGSPDPPVGRQIVCFGTVLPWLGDKRRSPILGADTFRASLAEQSRDWSALRARHAEAGLIVTGDFNQDLALGHYYGSRAGRAALREALRAGDLTCLTAGAEDPLADIEGRACIDHVCINQELRSRCVGAWPRGALPRSLTDRYGVWVDLYR